MMEFSIVQYEKVLYRDRIWYRILGNVKDIKSNKYFIGVLDNNGILKVYNIKNKKLELTEENIKMFALDFMNERDIFGIHIDKYFHNEVYYFHHKGFGYLSKYKLDIEYIAEIIQF